MSKILLPCACAMLLAAGAACGGSAKNQSTADSKKPAGKKTVDTSAVQAANSSSTNSAEPAHKSVFVINKEARDPFFPGSSPVATAEAGPAPEPVVDVLSTLRSEFQGIMASGGERIALINNTILVPGRSTEIPLAKGKSVKVRCREVLSNSVILEVEGQARPVTIARAENRR